MHKVEEARFTYTAIIATAVITLLIVPITFVNSQEQQQEPYLQSVSGYGQGLLPGDIPTLFSFTASEIENGNISGKFECFALMPDGNTMYVNGTVTNFAVNQSSVVLSGPTVVTGFGAGSGSFDAVIMVPEGRVLGETENADNGTLILTTDVNGDSVQASADDGSEGPFDEQIIKGTILFDP